MEEEPTFKKALALGEFWHKSNGSAPDNLKDRINLALNLTQREISPEDREILSDLIREFTQHEIGDLAKQGTFLSLLSKFENGKVTLKELLEYELNVIGEKELADAIKHRIADINNLVYRTLKRILDGDFRADALTGLDRIIDDTRNEEFVVAVKKILKQIEEDLHDLSKFREVRLTHTNPDPDIQEYQVHSRSLTGDDIIENTNINAFEWNKHVHKKLKVEWTQIPFPEDNETRLVFKLKFGDQEFGYLEYRFEGYKIHPLVFARCANMSAMIDTFLNTRLQNEVKKIIAEKKRKILSDYKFQDWTLMCTELCKILSKVLEKPIAFSCNLKPGEQKSWDVLVDGNNTEKDADFVGFTAEAIKRGGEFFELKIDRGKGKERVGSIMVACNDDSQRGIVNDALSFIEGIIMGREEARHWLSKLIGAPSADMWLANDIELNPTPHPVVVLYSDIDDYSKTVRELSISHPAAIGGIDEIMNRFISDAKLIIEKKFNVVIDKFVGDEAIVLIGPPYTKDGKDAFGNKEPNFAHNIDLAFEISEELQVILDKIAKDVQEEYHFNLPRRLVFANGCGIVDGDPVGIYGAPEKPGAGVDYTIFGNEMNRIARVLGKADAHEFLVPYDSYLKYVEDGGEKLVPSGEPFTVTTHGVGEFKVILLQRPTQEPYSLV